MTILILSVEPFRFKLYPPNLNIEPFYLKFDPLRLKFEPFYISFEPRNLTFEPLRPEIEPFSLKLYSLSLKFEPLKYPSPLRKYPLRFFGMGKRPKKEAPGKTPPFFVFNRRKGLNPRCRILFFQNVFSGPRKSIWLPAHSFW